MIATWNCNHGLWRELMCLIIYLILKLLTPYQVVQDVSEFPRWQWTHFPKQTYPTLESKKFLQKITTLRNWFHVFLMKLFKTNLIHFTQDGLSKVSSRFISETPFSRLNTFIFSTFSYTVTFPIHFTSSVLAIWTHYGLFVSAFFFN